MNSTIITVNSEDYQCHIVKCKVSVVQSKKCLFSHSFQVTVSECRECMKEILKLFFSFLLKNITVLWYCFTGALSSMSKSNRFKSILLTVNAHSYIYVCIYRSFHFFCHRYDTVWLHLVCNSDSALIPNNTSVCLPLSLSLSTIHNHEKEKIFLRAFFFYTAKEEIFPLIVCLSVLFFVLLMT
jgi:hypothetical protein